MYCAGAAGKTKGADVTKTVLRTERSNRRCRRQYAAAPDLDRGRVVAKKMSSCAWRFPKTLFALSRCRIAEDDGSGDLLSRSQLHANDRGEVGSAERKQNLDAFVGYLSHAAAVAFIGRTA